MLASTSQAAFGSVRLAPSSGSSARGRIRAGVRSSRQTVKASAQTDEEESASKTPTAEPLRLKAKRVTAENFKPFGQLVEPGEDGSVFGPDDAQLVLTNGTPRFYIMRLKAKGMVFDRITHHKKVTQCLAGVNDCDWYMGVAAPSEHSPRPEDITVFQIPPGVAVQMKMGTWHAGPYFDERPVMDFWNLELSDTNITDHTTHMFKKEGLSFLIEKP